MIILAAFVLGRDLPPAEESIKSMVAHYRKLKSFSATIIHHGDFMSDAKESTDTLFWLAPKRFEITSDKDSSPKLFSDGKKFTTFLPHLPPIWEALEQETQRIPTWEPRGGFILSILMKGQLADQLLHPGKPLKAAYDYGKALRWHDLPVSEVVCVLTGNGTLEHVSYYLTGDYKQLLGIEITNGNADAWTQYTNQVENAAVPKTLGDIPKG